MTTIYSTVTLTDEDKGKKEYNYECIQEIQVVLKGRKYFKYLEVVYGGKTFYGYVPWNATIDDVKFCSRRTVNHRLHSIYMTCGDKKVECKSKRELENYRECAKAGYYDEILAEMGVDRKGSGTEHVDKVLEAVRSVKILQDNDLLQLVHKIDELQTANNSLDKDNQRLLKENTELSTLHKENIERLQTEISKLTDERETFREHTKHALITTLGNL